MSSATLDDDPPPVPPVQPDLDDCCHSGCNPCVFDLYDEALERYETALAQWRERQAQKSAEAAKATKAVHAADVTDTPPASRKTRTGSNPRRKTS